MEQRTNMEMFRDEDKGPQCRGKIVALSTLLGFFCAVAAAFMRRFRNAALDAGTAEKKKYLGKLPGLRTEA